MKLFVVFSTEEESVAWKYLVDELQQLYSNGHVEPVPFYFGYKGKKYYYNCLYFSKSKLSKFLELYYNGKIKYIKEIVIEKIFVEQKNDELYNNQIAYLQKLLKKIKQFRKQLHEICPEKRMLRENKIYRMSIMTLDIKEKYILTRIVAESDNPIISSEMQHTVDAILARIERAYIDAESASAIGDIYGVVCEVDIADTLSRKIIDM